MPAPLPLRGPLILNEPQACKQLQRKDGCAPKLALATLAPGPAALQAIEP